MAVLQGGGSVCFGFQPFTFGHVCDADSRFPSGMETYDVHENQIPSGARQKNSPCKQDGTRTRYTAL